MNSVKEQVRELVDTLPEGVTWDDVMYAVYVRQKFEAGVKAGEPGRVVPHEEVMERYASRS